MRVMLDWTNIEAFQENAERVEEIKVLNECFSWEKSSKQTLVETLIRVGFYGSMIGFVSKNLVISGGGLKLGAYLSNPSQLEPLMDALKLMVDGVSKL